MQHAARPAARDAAAAHALRGALQPVSSGHAVAGVDYLYTFSRYLAHQGAQEWVMSAAEDYGVSALLHHRHDGIAHCGAGLRAAHIPAFDRFHQPLTGREVGLHPAGPGEAAGAAYVVAVLFEAGHHGPAEYTARARNENVGRQRLALRHRGLH